MKIRPIRSGDANIIATMMEEFDRHLAMMEGRRRRILKRATARADLLSLIIQEGTFRKIDDGLFLQVGERLPDNRLGGIFVADSREEGANLIYYAKSGSVVEKGDDRDMWQVLANGGVFALLALSSLVSHSAMIQVAAAGALAASTADTWSTEIGALSRSRPRSILTMKPVPYGTSGGVTIQGLVASVAGSGFVALTKADGTHEVTFSPDNQYYVDRWSRVDSPPVHELHRSIDDLIGAGL